MVIKVDRRVSCPFRRHNTIQPTCILHEIVTGTVREVWKSGYVCTTKWLPRLTKKTCPLKAEKIGVKWKGME